MAEVRWTDKADRDVAMIDAMRIVDHDLPPIMEFIKELVRDKFADFDLEHFNPGKPVTIRGEPVDLYCCLVTPGKRGEPYKVFYRLLRTEQVVEIRRVRHPRQKPLPGFM